MLDYLKSLWLSVFGKSGDGPIFGYQPPSNPLPPPPPERPAPPSEPSCFAKGIAASLRDEPREWVEESGDGHAFYTSEVRQKVRLSIRHNQTQARLVWYDRWFAECVVINGASVCDTDTAHILSTIRAHPLGQYKAELDRVKAEQEQQAAMKAHFEHLGCPPLP